MAKGWVTTARGEQLNLDQLIINAKRPLYQKDEKTEIKKRIVHKRKPLNVRGYKPSTGESKVPEMTDEMKSRMEQRSMNNRDQTARRAAYRDGGVAESYADLTGVKLKPTKYAIERRKAQIAKSKDEIPEETPAEDEALVEILEELEGHDEGTEPETDKKSTTRRRDRKS